MVHGLGHVITMRCNGSSMNTVLHILQVALAVAGEEQTQKSPWPVVVLLQLMEHVSAGRWPCLLQCYLQMVEVAKLYFDYKCLIPSWD